MSYRTLYTAMSDENKAKLHTLHCSAEAICDYIDWLVEKKASRDIIDTASEYLEKLEFDMQDCWGFERDANKHTWWLQPKSCTCPKLDNTDPMFYGRGKIKVEDCPVHGFKK